jgi:hypothetical protein
MDGCRCNNNEYGFSEEPYETLKWVSKSICIDIEAYSGSWKWVNILISQYSQKKMTINNATSNTAARLGLYQRPTDNSLDVSLDRVDLVGQCFSGRYG